MGKAVWERKEKEKRKKGFLDLACWFFLLLLLPPGQSVRKGKCPCPLFFPLPQQRERERERGGGVSSSLFITPPPSNPCSSPFNGFSLFVCFFSSSSPGQSVRKGNLPTPLPFNSLPVGNSCHQIFLAFFLCVRFRCGWGVVKPFKVQMPSKTYQIQRKAKPEQG